MGVRNPVIFIGVGTHLSEDLDSFCSTSIREKQQELAVLPLFLSMQIIHHEFCSPKQILKFRNVYVSTSFNKHQIFDQLSGFCKIVRCPFKEFRVWKISFAVNRLCQILAELLHTCIKLFT
jgi:hypothetical protein